MRLKITTWLLAIVLVSCNTKEVVSNFSWARLGNNQEVSFGDANDAVNTSVFFSKMSFSSSTTHMTKSDANTYLKIDSSYEPLAMRSANQFVLKSDLLPMSVIKSDDLVDGKGGIAGTGPLNQIATAFCGNVRIAPAFYTWGSSQTELRNGLTRFYRSYVGSICVNPFGPGKYVIYWAGKNPGIVAIELDLNGVVIGQYSCKA